MDMAACTSWAWANNREFARGKARDLLLKALDGAACSSTCFKAKLFIMAVIERSMGMTGDCCLIT